MAYNLLQNKFGIITGALDENSIAWKAAEQIYAEGGRFVLTNSPIALRVGATQVLAERCNTIVIPADATNTADIENLYQKSTQYLDAKIDFLLHSIGMSANVRKQRTYDNLNYDWFLKTLDVSALSFHKFIQTGDSLEAFNQEASIVALSYIAAQKAFPFYNDMAEAKAVLESIARSYGAILGQKKGIRINTISQSPTMTTAGKGIKGFEEFLNFAGALAPLGNASALDCANYIVTLFSDLTKKVTMQNLFHDGGFSTTGMTETLIKRMAKIN